MIINHNTLSPRYLGSTGVAIHPHLSTGYRVQQKTRWNHGRKPNQAKGLASSTNPLAQLLQLDRDSEPACEQHRWCGAATQLERKQHHFASGQVSAGEGVLQRKRASARAVAILHYRQCVLLCRWGRIHTDVSEGRAAVQQVHTFCGFAPEAAREGRCKGEQSAAKLASKAAMSKP